MIVPLMGIHNNNNDDAAAAVAGLLCLGLTLLQGMTVEGLVRRDLLLLSFLAFTFDLLRRTRRS
jgi:hypothetical protein